MRGKTIALLAADRYQEMEVWYPLLRFPEDGARGIAAARKGASAAGGEA